MAPYAAGAFPGTVPQRRRGVPAWVWIAGGAGLLVVLCLVGGIFLLSAARKAGLAQREAERVQAEHGEFGTGTTVRLGGEMVSEQEARAFAQRFLPVLQPRLSLQERINRLDPIFHLKGYLARMLQTRQVPRKSDPNFPYTARRTIGTIGLSFHHMTSFRGVTLVRVSQRDGYRSLLFRTNDLDPKDIHYSEVLLIRDQGQVKVLDFYSHRLGTYVSTITRWELVTSSSVKKPEDTLVRLPAQQFALVRKHQESLSELTSLLSLLSYTLLQEKYESLPPEVKKWRIVQLGRLLSAAKEDSRAEVFRQIAAQFQKLFPDDPVVLFASLEFHDQPSPEHPEKVFELLGQLAVKIEDPYLLVVRGKYVVEKELQELYDQAQQSFQAALEQLKRPEEQNQARIGLAQIHLLKKDYPRLLEIMTQLRKHDRRPWEKIEIEIMKADISEFFQFKRTAEYKQWKEQHMGSSGGNR